MIVTCPACSARYKINESKIQGRGAKITCPRCGHRFVVYKDGAGEAEGAAREDVTKLDFSQVGITWRVRKSLGVNYDFYDLGSLLEYMQEGQITQWDQITYDNIGWVTIDSIQDLEAYFWDVWQRARNGEIQVADPSEAPRERGEDDEDVSDAPTTIVGHGTSLASEIRKALHDATPAPASGRSFSPPTPNREPDPGVSTLLDEPVPLDDPPSSGGGRSPLSGGPSPLGAKVSATPEPASPAAPPPPAPTGSVDIPTKIDLDEERRRRGAAPPPPPAKPALPPPPAKAEGGGGGVALLAVAAAAGVGILVLVPVVLYVLGFFGNTGSPGPQDHKEGTEAPAPKDGTEAAAPVPAAPVPGPKLEAPAPAEPAPAPTAAPAAPKPEDKPKPGAPKPADKPKPGAPKPADKPKPEAPAPVAAPEPAPAAPEPAPAAPEPAPAAPEPAPPAPEPAPAAPAPTPEPAPGG